MHEKINPQISVGNRSQGRQKIQKKDNARAAKENAGFPKASITIYIYGLTDPRSGEIKYVGKTSRPYKRLYSHLSDKRVTHKSCWVKSLISVGLKPTMAILEEIEDSSDALWQERERFWIHYLKGQGCNLTNLDEGGRNGKTPSLETREKISKANKGRVISEEVREQIRLKLTGRKLTPDQLLERKSRKASDETKRKMSLAQKSKWTPEMRKILSESKKGIVYGESMRQKLRDRVFTAEHRLKISLAKKGKSCKN